MTLIVHTSSLIHFLVFFLKQIYIKPFNHPTFLSQDFQCHMSWSFSCLFQWLFVLLISGGKQNVDHHCLNYLFIIVELLARFKLWTISNDLINICHLDTISMMNQQSTTINVTCNQCSRNVTRVGWLCDRCKSVINTCAVW